MTYLFLDIETTGLNPLVHEVWEIGYTFDLDPVSAIQVPHVGASADPDALKMNGYYRRNVVTHTSAWIEQRLRAKIAETRPTLVGANPAFDAAFLRERWGLWHEAPWRYRMIDIESMALQQFGWDAPAGLGEIAEVLRDKGFPIAFPDHTAGMDACVTRQAFYALRQLGGHGEAPAEVWR